MARVNRRGLAVVAEVDDVEAAAQFASCRGLGHEWKHRKPAAVADGVLFSSACAVCGTERSKWISRSGAYRNASYTYPDSYSLHGEHRLSTVQWRQVLVTTALD